MTRTFLLGTLLLFPSLGAVYHLFEKHDRGDFSPYVNRRPAKLAPYRFPSDSPGGFETMRARRIGHDAVPRARW